MHVQTNGAVKMWQMQDARAEAPDVAWRKSARSGAQGNCVELAAVPAGLTAVRNSRFPTGPALVFTADEMAAFVAGVKDGEFDDMLGSA